MGSEGIRPNPSQIEGMIEMPTPTDKLAVKRMLGVVNYVAKFIPSLAQKTTRLSSLIKHDELFEWSKNHTNEWKQLCDTLGKQPLLSIFHPKKETKMSCDASTL